MKDRADKAKAAREFQLIQMMDKHKKEDDSRTKEQKDAARELKNLEKLHYKDQEKERLVKEKFVNN